MFYEMFTRRVCLSGRHSRDSREIVKPILALFHNACKRYKTRAAHGEFSEAFAARSVR